MTQTIQELEQFHEMLAGTTAEKFTANKELFVWELDRIIRQLKTDIADNNSTTKGD